MAQEADNTDSDMLEYAKAVLFCARNMDNAAIWDTNPTPLQKSLLDWLGNPAHKGIFFKDMLPKAQDTIIKAKLGQDPDQIGVLERRSVADLRAILRQHIEQAEKVTV